MNGAAIPKIKPGGAARATKVGGAALSDKDKGKKPIRIALAAGGLIPVWMDTETAKFLVRALTSALEGNLQPKKKKTKKK